MAKEKKRVARIEVGDEVIDCDGMRGTIAKCPCGCGCYYICDKRGYEGEYYPSLSREYFKPLYNSPLEKKILAYLEEERGQI